MGVSYTLAEPIADTPSQSETTPLQPAKIVL